MKQKYIGIKVQGIDHWLWFKQTCVTRDTSGFKGVEGWGKDGAYTNIEIPCNLIEGEIESDCPQY